MELSNGGYLIHRFLEPPKLHGVRLFVPFKHLGGQVQYIDVVALTRQYFVDVIPGVSTFTEVRGGIYHLLDGPIISLKAIPNIDSCLFDHTFFVDLSLLSIKSVCNYMANFNINQI